MPLTLVTGPANAEKAGVVLARLRALVDRDPILVVPTLPDVERYRRELADSGIVFGARTETFARLLAEIARRAGIPGPPLGEVARERLVVAAAADARLELLAPAARTPGFPRAACRLFDELEEERIGPARFVSALRAWGAQEPDRAAYAEELGRLYAAYRRRLDHLGRRDAALHRAAALDAIREDPGRWGDTPVLFYGFDDLTPIERDAVLALAATEADVTLSLTYEPGRHAFAARGEDAELLRPVATTVRELAPNAEHYAPEARSALHRLERDLFEAPAGDAEAGDAVVFLEGGGERAELELVAAEVARLIRDDGVPPDEIAVVLRRPAEAVALVTRVFESYGIPVAARAEVPFGHTPLGRGLVALLRAATGGTAADVIAWLRTPGRIRAAGFVDRLEAEVRRTGARTAAEARALWERAHPELPLDALDRVAEAAADGPAALVERLDTELVALFAAPYRRTAPVLDRGQEAEAQVLRAGRRVLAGLAEAAALDPGLVPAPDELAALLAGRTVRLGDRAVPGAVQVTDPKELRARRVQAVFLCRMQEGIFPAPARPDPFLSDDERRALNAASGLRLTLREDVLARERYLLYAAVSRPERRLYVSWHAADDEGEPAVRSAFVDDIALVFGDRPLERRRRRDLGAVGWTGRAVPTERERLRAAAHAAPTVREPVAAPLSHPEVLADLRARRAWAASTLETFASCPVKWFVERLLDPQPLDPDPEPRVRGTLAHQVLETALRRLADGGGLTPARLPEARAAVRSALEEHADELRLSPDPARRRAIRRRLEADLLRYVEAAALSGSRFVPRHLEERVELDAGDGIVLRGQVDRIDVRPGTDEAILYDYKGKTAYPGARWLDEGRFQLAVYALAARRRLGLDPVGALYQPLGAADLRPRGALREDADPDLAAFRSDRLPPEAFDALLEDAVRAAVEAARAARDGALEPRPDTCAWGGGCAYPTICRCEA
jgi:ATP-dependent helicase/DNAse subunit B